MSGRVVGEATVHETASCCAAPPRWQGARDGRGHSVRPPSCGCSPCCPQAAPLFRDGPAASRRIPTGAGALPRRGHLAACAPPASGSPLTHEEDEDEAGQRQGRAAADHADQEPDERAEQQRCPEQPVQERPGPPRGHHGRPREGARPAVLLLEGVLGTERRPECPSSRTGQLRAQGPAGTRGCATATSGCPRGDMERQGHRSSATKSWGASQPAPASSDWAGERPEAQAQGAGTASQAVHTGQGDEGGAALSQAPAPGCRRGLSSDGPPKLNSVCARPGLTARRVCVLRLCRTFTPRPPRGGGGRHRLLRSLTALGVSPFLTGSHPENTLRGGRARQACLRPVSAYERLLLRGGESSGKQASRGLKCWVLSFNTRLKRLEYVLLLFQPGCTG